MTLTKLLKDRSLSNSHMNRVKFISIIFFMILFSCNNQTDLKKIENDYNKKIETFIETCWNKKDLSEIENIFADDFTRIVNNINVASNPQELEAIMNVYFTGFPDLSIAINNSFIKDNKAFFNWTLTGTNTGEFGEVQATGKKVKLTGFATIVFNDEGKIFHEDVCYNDLDFLQQLGYTLSPPIVE